MSSDVLIRNGMMMDGTGKPAFRADVLVRDERLEDIGLFPDAQAAQVIDAEGLVVAPGFIDTHTHTDFLLASPRHPRILECYARQGVTTLVGGVDGFSPAPMHESAWEDITTYWNFSLPREGLERQWSTMEEFLSFLEGIGQAFNTAIFTGHNVLRASVMGYQTRFAEAREMAEMKRMLEESMEAGSFGLSSGFYYCPGIFSNTDEVVELASVLTEFQAPFMIHTRSLTDLYDKAIDEAVEIAEKSGIPLHISHHAGGSFTDPGVRERADQAVSKAMERGVSISHENIPWLCGPTASLALLPPRLLEGGLKRAIERLKDPGVRQKAANDMMDVVLQWPPWEHDYWTDKFFSAQNVFSGFKSQDNLRFEHRPLEGIAEEMGKNAFDAFFDLVVEEDGRIFFLGKLADESLGDEVMGELYMDPHCCVMTDVVGLDYAPPNPVACGAFPKVLGSFCREKGLMSQEEGVRRMTSLPAESLGIKDRGILRKGAFADITVFDPRTVIHRSTFEDPHLLPEGIEYVFINGKMVLDRGEYHAGALAGRVLKR